MLSKVLDKVPGVKNVEEILSETCLWRVCISVVELLGITVRNSVNYGISLLI